VPGLGGETSRERGSDVGLSCLIDDTGRDGSLQLSGVGGDLARGRDRETYPSGLGGTTGCEEVLKLSGVGGHVGSWGGVAACT
jgi:hypothetical protein